MAENHPVAFQWVVEAKLRGATVIHVDPRFTRTSALARRHVPIRSGSDVAFVGALVNHVLSNELDFREYVVTYTNAPSIVSEEFRDTEDLDGLFSGWDEKAGNYDRSSWQLTGERDETLANPRCVYQVLKRHFARYTPELVEQVCGVPPEQFAAVADAVTRNSGRDRTTAFVYSVGWTHHTVGVQNIRTAAILQMLLGNMGRPGGGIMALRGHASIQGSTDIPTLFDLLSGYMSMPMPTRMTWTASWPPGRRRLASGAVRVCGQPAQVMVRRCRNRRERLVLLPAAAHQRRSRNLRHGEQPARRRVQGLLPGRGKPSSRLGQRQDAAARAGPPRLAGRA